MQRRIQQQQGLNRSSSKLNGASHDGEIVDYLLNGEVALLLLPPTSTPVCRTWLERRRTQLAFGVLRITVQGGEILGNLHSEVAQHLTVCDAALLRGEPLLVLFDLAEGQLPPFSYARPLLNQLAAWAGANAHEWDSLVQGLAIVLTSPIARGFLQTATALMQPPQPIAYCADVPAALDFLGGIREARSYVKGDYK